MALDLLIGLLAQSIQVEVLNAETAEPIEAVQVMMEGGPPPPRQEFTRPNGRTAPFRVACSSTIKFWARSPDDPSFPTRSARAGCRRMVRLVRLKLTPSSN